MDGESAILGTFALTTVQIALSFTSCDFPVAMQFFSNCTVTHAINYQYGTYVHTVKKRERFRVVEKFVNQESPAVYVSLMNWDCLKKCRNQKS